jgi:glyoxylase-like metal-dependent hydrolase (beta-lactamase superfamily II)
MPEKPITVPPEEFKEMLDKGKVQFMFDLRAEDEFEGWRIEGRTPVETLNIPQEDFVGEEDEHLSRFPKDKEIITVCAHGDSSKYSAELLREKGFNARGLEGGMDLWSEFYETRKVNTDPDIYQIYRVAKGCMTHVIVSGGEAAVIDAVRHIEHIEKVLGDTGAKLVHVFDTHLQADHISGGRELAQKHNAPYHISSSDAADATYDYVPLCNDQVFNIGRSSMVIAFQTPGHTPGSTSLILDGKFMFSGDTIMPSSAGRPDLGGMVRVWAELLFCTLHERLADLPDDMVIFPTHAAGIHEQNEDGIVRLTLGEARGRLPLMGIRDHIQFIERIEATLPENPERYKDIRKVNLGRLDPDEKKRKELEIGKNLCGMAKAGKG